jgi:hypothetical protein
MADITGDLWQDFELDTLNPTNLASRDHVNDGDDNGTWGVENADGNLSTTTSAEKVSTGLINGNSDSSATRGLRYLGDANDEPGTVQYEFETRRRPVSGGFWFMFPTAFVGSEASGEPDILNLTNILGSNELYIKLLDNGVNSFLDLFTGDSGHAAVTVTVQPETWYWITFLYGSTHRMRVYDEDGNQVGSEASITGAGGANEELDTAFLGNLIGDPVWGPYDFDDWVLDWTNATFPVLPPIATIELEQEGFAFGDDDGSESAHTLGTQDTNHTGAADATKTLRLIYDGTGEGEVTPTLRFQQDGSGGYIELPVGATSDIPPTVSATLATESGNNTATGSWAVAVPDASAGDLLIFGISWDDSLATTDVTEPSGQNSEVLSEVNATPATDSSTETRSKVWYTVATGAWTAGTITFTPSANEQWTATTYRVAAGEFDATTPIGASTTNGSTATTESNVQHGAFSAGSTDGGGLLFTWTSADADPQTVAANFSEVANEDRGAVSGGLFVRDATVTDSESFSATTIATIGSDSWSSVSFVVRPNVVTNDIYIPLSANITAGGEATTARLTAPSGKTSGADFVAGRRWDDENGVDATTFTAGDKYSEFEWPIYVASGVTGYVEFQGYDGGTALGTYTVTPRWTISAGGGSSAVPIILQQSAANDSQYETLLVVNSTR